MAALEIADIIVEWVKNKINNADLLSGASGSRPEN